MGDGITAVWLRLRSGRGAVGAALVVLVGVLLMGCLMAPSPVLAAFPDVPRSHDYYDGIDALASRNVIQGYTNGQFGPRDPVTRQQFAKMIILTLQLYSSLGIVVDESDVCPFWDVMVSGPGSLYPDNYVAEAAAQGITVGTGGGAFSPYDSISRAQAVTMVVRAVEARFPGVLGAVPAAYWTLWPSGFDPIHAPNARRAEYNGLLNGLDLDRLDPWGAMTRGEVAQMLYSTMGAIEQRDGVPLHHFWWTAADGWKVENLAVLTGQKVKHLWMGSYQVPQSAGQSRQYVLASSINDDLLSFTASTSQPGWEVTNLSQSVAFGLKLSGPCTVWTTGMDMTNPRPNVAGRDPQGNLLHFADWPGNWIITHVTNYTGRKVLQAPMDSWVTRTGTSYVEHVAAVGLGGEVLVFSRPEAGFWQVTDLSVATGVAVDGNWTHYPATGLSYWQTPSGGGQVDHLVGVTAAGEVLVFWSANGSAWQVVDVSAITGSRVRSLPTPWVSPLPSGEVEEQLAAIGTSGELLRFSYMEGVHGWQVQNISGVLPGLQLWGTVEEWTTNIPGGGGVDHLAVRTLGSDLVVVYGMEGTGTWQQVNVSGVTGQKTKDPLLSWRTGVMPTVAEHVMAFGQD